MVSVCQALLITLLGCLFQFPFFLDTPFLLLLLLFFSFTLSMQFVAMLIAVLSPNQKTGNSVAYGFLLLSWVIQIILSNVLLQYGLYKQDIASWLVVVRRVLTLYPPFNFCKIWTDISQYSGCHWDITQNMWVTGDGYQWTDIFVAQKGSFAVHQYHAPPTIINLLYIYMDLFIFMLLALYFDAVLTHNTGNAKKWWFIFDFKSMFKKK